MTEKSLNIELATPNKKLEIGLASSCSAPGVLGKFQILPGHTAFISELEVGEIKVELPDKTEYYAVSGGFLEVVQDRVLLLLESAESAQDIDIERAQQAIERAKDLLDRRNDPGEINVEVIRAEAALARAINRLQVAHRNSI